MIMIFNIMHGRVGLRREDFFDEPRAAQTRGHQLKVGKPQSTSRTRTNHFSTHVVNDWNSLPEEVACAPSLNSFKNRLDKYWIARAYDAPA